MQQIRVDATRSGTSFKPYWKKCVCAGRAAEGLREDWRNQLRELQREIGFEYLRFHGIFHDDMMVYSEDADGRSRYNWQYFDNLIDFLLGIGIRPFLELSFTPGTLASGPETIFWWKGNVTPPKSYKKWAKLVRVMLVHAIGRYGLDEVRRWYFEVWNEPTITPFWAGTQDQYFELYAATACIVKSVDKGLRVGGPSSTSPSPCEFTWFEEFLGFCARRGLPLDFVSAHPYPNNWPLDNETGTQIMAYRPQDSTLWDLQWIRDTVARSGYPSAEIHLTEWNSSPSPRDLVHDTAFMLPFILKNNAVCIGLVDSLGFWTFTDVFEENGAGATLFHGGFGMMNAQGLKKPSYYAYWMLSRLGNERIGSGDGWMACRKGLKLQILLWNYCHYEPRFEAGDRMGISDADRYHVFAEHDVETFAIRVSDLSGCQKVTVFRMDREHGSVYDEWLRNGALEYPTPEEIAILIRKAGPEASISLYEPSDAFERAFEVPPHGTVLIEIEPVEFGKDGD